MKVLIALLPKSHDPPSKHVVVQEEDSTCKDADDWDKELSGCDREEAVPLPCAILKP